MRPIIRTVMFFCMTLLVLTYAIILAYAADVKESNFNKHVTNIDKLTVRKEDLLMQNEQLEVKKAALQSQLVAQTEKERLQKLDADLAAAKLAKEDLLKQQQAILAAQKATQTKTVQRIQNTKVTTTKTVAKTVKKARTRAS